ncbi:hypothetical protein [Amycolatopsis methanolica]|nr:hypothetical protein [Amycolatopsis methanolica]
MRCRFEGEAGPVDALRGIDLDVPRRARPRCCAAGLRTPTAGTAELDG